MYIRWTILTMNFTTRLLLPAELREKAGIDREVVIVGNTGFFEVWSEKRRAELVEEIDISSLLS